ncbi:MAG: DNA-processing protein DprA [Chloroflexota bacterium]
MDIKSLSKDQPSYPITSQDWFRELDCVGNAELLNLPMLAIFSSAKCPASLILKAHDFAKEIRNGETGIISGFHAPAEKEVLEVLLKGTCPIIAVLGRRLEGARIPSMWKSEIDKGRMLVISPFNEYQAHVTKVMSLKSNDIAARIARRVIIIHASPEGSLISRIEKWKADNIIVETWG